MTLFKKQTKPYTVSLYVTGLLLSNIYLVQSLIKGRWLVVVTAGCLYCVVCAAAMYTVKHPRNT